MVLTPPTGSYLSRRWARGPLFRYTQTGVPSPTATSPKRREVIRNLALSLWAAGHKSPDLTVGDNDLRVRFPPGGRSGAATCQPGRSAQGRLPRVRTPADRSRTPVGWSWNPTCGSRTSRRPEPSSQSGRPDPAPRSGRGPEPPRAPVGAAARPPGPAPPRVPVGATADLRVRCRHVSHRRKPSAGSQPACRIKCGGGGVRCQSRAWGAL